MDEGRAGGKAGGCGDAVVGKEPLKDIDEDGLYVACKDLGLI